MPAVVEEDEEPPFYPKKPKKDDETIFNEIMAEAASHESEEDSPTVLNKNDRDRMRLVAEALHAQQKAADEAAAAMGRNRGGRQFND